ncbi:MAG: hypothetical protein WCY82_08765 [Desulfotomaculaceae bacterium]
MMKKLIGLGMAILFMTAMAAAVYLVLDLIGDPAMKPASSVINNLTGDGVVETLVGPYTTVKKINYYRSCGDRELYSLGPAEKELVGLDLDRLKMKYPASGAWDVSYKNDEVTITRNIDGYCGLHREYRHLGIHDGKTAVYQGPLGNDEVLLRVEKNIDISLLPADWRERLEKSAVFNSLAPDEKFNLQETIEFPDEHALNMVLENFDEMDGEKDGTN